MTATTVPQASLLESWSVATVERLARAMGRPAAAHQAAAASEPERAVDPVRGARRTEALLRLALDASAAPAERALAAERAAAHLRRSA